MTLMPVSNISVLRLELVERRRLAVDLPALVDLERLALLTSSGSPITLNTWPR